LPGAALAEPDRLERVLPLCRSPDPVARRFCIHEILLLGDPNRRARSTLRELAVSDEALSALAARALRDLYGDEPPPRRTPPVSPPAPDRWLPDPGSTRTIFFPTAFTRPRGEASWTIFDAGHWTFDYGAADNLEFGVQTGPPIGAFVIAPQVKAAIHGRSGSMGLFAFGGAFIPVVGDMDTALFYGGGPIFTAGSREYFGNLGLQTYGLSVADENIAFLLPNVGGSARLSRRLRASVEILVPDVLGDDYGDDLDPGDLIVVIYGLRLVGESVWGDIAFAYPVCDDCGDVTDVLPLGLPLLGLGFSW